MALLNEQLAFGIYRRRSLVENKYRRIIKQCAYKSDQLPLPHRKRTAPFHYIEVVPAGQSHDEVVNIDEFSRLDHLLF